MRLLHVDSSPRGETSKSRSLSRGFVDDMLSRSPDLSVDYLDLADEAPPHVTADFITATYTAADERTSEMRETLAQSDALCARVLAADFLVFSMPMYNFTMPSTFKAFIDAIVRTSVTYIVESDGRYVGRLGDKKVLFITTRGVDLSASSSMSHMDGLTPALRAAFGFIGVAEPTFVDAQPVQFAPPPECAQAMARARRELAAVASRWACDREGHQGGTAILDKSQHPLATTAFVRRLPQMHTCQAPRPTSETDGLALRSEFPALRDVSPHGKEAEPVGMAKWKHAPPSGMLDTPISPP